MMIGSALCQSARARWAFCWLKLSTVVDVTDYVVVSRNPASHTRKDWIRHFHELWENAVRKHTVNKYYTGTITSSSSSRRANQLRRCETQKPSATRDSRLIPTESTGPLEIGIDTRQTTLSFLVELEG